jgi:hypothetical protein
MEKISKNNSKKLVNAWNELLEQSGSTVLQVACKLDLNPSFFFVTDLVDANGAKRLGDPLTKQEIITKLGSAASTHDFEQFGSTPWFSRSSKATLLGMARTVAYAAAYRNAMYKSAKIITQLNAGENRVLVH